MNAQLGRPPKEVTKNINIGFRLSKETVDKLVECAEKMQTTRTAVVEKGIDLVYKSIK